MWPMRLLTKSTKSKSVQDSDVFTVNPKFKSKLMKVRVPVVTAKPKTAQKVPKQVQEDRRVLVEAAIVRIMKTRQVSEVHYVFVPKSCKFLNTYFLI